MVFVYFTAGETLGDGEIRRQCLRIPEVMTAVREAQREHDLDLMSCLGTDDEYRKMNDFQRRELTALVQKGLFERFCRFRIPYADIIRRSNYRAAAAVAKEFNWLLRSGDPITVYVIGPALDEVPALVANPKAEWIDIIDHDPQLAWFWGGIKKAANA